MKHLSRSLALASALACIAAAPAQNNLERMAAGVLSLARYPYLPGSRIVLHADGMTAPFDITAVGVGDLQGDDLTIPLDAQPQMTMLVAGNRNALATHPLQIAAAPEAGESVIAVASYDDGVVLHDPGTLAPTAILGIGGASADVAIDASGRIAAADTGGQTLTIASRDPWSVRTIAGVDQTDEIAFDNATGAIFATDRDVNGLGALTRIGADSSVTRVITGETAEGLAIDERRQLAYVANANDGTVAVIDARTMTVQSKFHCVGRNFSLVLSSNGTRLYAVSNQSLDSPFGASGGVVAYDIGAGAPRLFARSAHLSFPIGIAYDEPDRRLFVTDERDDTVDVLDDRTLNAVHAPLATCKIPWLPSFDAQTQRVYVPCAGSDAIDVFDARTLRRVAGAPFPTGGYPLAVAIWHGRS